MNAVESAKLSVVDRHGGKFRAHAGRGRGGE